ncbi:hypothetical protein K438DRAFT_1780258 [Mycena galopus ATCC 62051]|nr:hypothetical protein K438DRAFT_1780258 [Mycena galopus ATCC 62051]
MALHPSGGYVPRLFMKCRNTYKRSIYKISGSGSHRLALMAFESHFLMDKSATRFPECDWLRDGFDGNKIGTRCADASATDANYSCEFTHCLITTDGLGQIRNEIELITMRRDPRNRDLRQEGLKNAKLKSKMTCTILWVFVAVRTMEITQIRWGSPAWGSKASKARSQLAVDWHRGCCQRLGDIVAMGRGELKERKKKQEFCDGVGFMAVLCGAARPYDVLETSGGLE